MAVDIGPYLPACAAIIMVGLAVIKLIGKNKKGNNTNGRNYLLQKDIKDFIPRKEMIETFKDKLKNVVYGDTCDANIRGFKMLIKANQKSSEKQLELVKDHLSDKIDSILTEIKNGKK